VETTKCRLAYKRSTPPSAERGATLVSLWADCREAKEDVRYLQLAYALVRGRPYWQQERHCNLNNRPSAYLLSQVVGCTKEEAKAWLDTPMPADECARFAEHQRLAREKAAAARAARPKPPRAAA
jgi:hypothetical protein